MFQNCKEQAEGPNRALRGIGNVSRKVCRVGHIARPVVPVLYDLGCTKSVVNNARRVREDWDPRFELIDDSAVGTACA